MKTDLKDVFCTDVNRVELFYSGVRQHLVLVLSNFPFCYYRFFVCLFVCLFYIVMCILYKTGRK
jgi:hypothetical protein